MSLRSWTVTQLAGVLFVVVGLMNLLTADFLLGVVWALLGVSMMAYVAARDAEGRPLRRFDATPRNVIALAAVVVALVLLVVELVTDFG